MAGDAVLDKLEGKAALVIHRLKRLLVDKVEMELFPSEVRPSATASAMAATYREAAENHLQLNFDLQAWMACMQDMAKIDMAMADKIKWMSAADCKSSAFPTNPILWADVQQLFGASTFNIDLPGLGNVVNIAHSMSRKKISSEKVAGFVDKILSEIAHEVNTFLRGGQLKQISIGSEFKNQVFTAKLQTFYDELLMEGTLRRATMNGLQQIVDEEFKKRGLDTSGHSGGGDGGRGGGGGGDDGGQDGQKQKIRKLTSVPKNSEAFTLTSPELSVDALVGHPQNHQGAGVRDCRT